MKISKYVDDNYFENIKQILSIEPVVNIIPYDDDYHVGLRKYVDNLELVLDYPIVYLVYDRINTHEGEYQYKVYVGETSNIDRRIREHLKFDSMHQKDWQGLRESKNSQIMVIGDKLFNKSLTLDIENRLMHHLLGVKNIVEVTNRRSNPQSKYFMSEYTDHVFSDVWNAMRKCRPEMLLEQEKIEKSAIYEFSPFYSLNQKQNEAKVEIIQKVEKALYGDHIKSPTMILITGRAGTGKTVLMSSLFYELAKMTVKNENSKNISVSLIISQSDQLKIYKRIANKLRLNIENTQIVTSPVSFLNTHDTDHKVDVMLIDEAHLLLTQGRMAYRGKNQLSDLLKLAKVVIVVFDRFQILTTQAYLDQKEIQVMENRAKREDNLIELKEQERMDAKQETIDWIQHMAVEQYIETIPDDEHYQLKIAKSPEILYQKIVQLDSLNGSKKSNLARLLATFDWQYNSKTNMQEKTGYWMVKIGTLKLPWNFQKQKELSRCEKKQVKDLAWAEQPHTLGETGSTYTIQGFGLNYVGVIIGPSVTYRNGKIEFVSENSMNENATRRRLLHGKRIDVSKELLRNELNILLTRGVHGLFIYAVDPDLQQALINVAGKDHILKE
ncbi:DNA/RNA helicase domain-containing protein [Lactiplantibacillus herbarum]|uniref:DNA/RNA helicase domain-containing protein n=1 Tax=Lactiplantibacillus herbarum TaxID=1670446 RepID=UPI00069D8E22|nr:DNA/RNA helicase domain-containing protein [Lactiplantibacillus herbarum]